MWGREKQMFFAMVLPNFMSQKKRNVLMRPFQDNGWCYAKRLKAGIWVRLFFFLGIFAICVVKRGWNQESSLKRPSCGPRGSISIPVYLLPTILKAILNNNQEMTFRYNSKINCTNTAEHNTSVRKYWKIPFYPSNTDTGTFYGGSTDIDTDVQYHYFMLQTIFWHLLFKITCFDNIITSCSMC